MRKQIPTIAELLQVIEAYNKAHELDLEELAARGNGASTATPENPFLEDLYFAAAGAAAALRPLMNHVVLQPARREKPNSAPVKK